jgi:hypothetical protein
LQTASRQAAGLFFGFMKTVKGCELKIIGRQAGLMGSGPGSLIGKSSERPDGPSETVESETE